MIGRLLRRPDASRWLSRVERPEAVVLAMLLAAVAAVGWLATPFWLAVAIAAQLAIGGLGAVWVLGPARPGLGFARYASLAAAGVALTLFGRVVVDAGGLLLAPLAAALLWVVLRLELEVNRTGRGGVALDLVMVGIVFAAAAGVAALIGPDAWPPGLLLLAAITSVPAMRLAEARGRSGAEAVGQALLHLLGVAQAAAAVALLQLPGVVGAAVVALAFHAWSGAAEALDSGASAHAVVLEFGALAVLGLVVALLLHAG